MNPKRASKTPLKIITAIQVRLGSKRLPEKALRDIAGQQLIVRVLERVTRSKETDVFVVATAKKDLPILQPIATRFGVLCVGGSEADLIARYQKVFKKCGGDALVRIVGDSPLIDPELIDFGIREFRKRFPKISFVSTHLSKKFPQGVNYEIISREAMLVLDQELKSEDEREAFMLYVSRHPKKFPVYIIKSRQDFSHIRLSVDYPEDLELINKIYSHFLSGKNINPNMRQIISFLKKNPSLIKINNHHIDKTKYPFNLDERALKKAL